MSLTAITSPSDDGATVRILGEWVVYDAAADDNNDSFNYSVTDGITASLGKANVVVATGPTGLTLNIVTDNLVGSH